MERDGLKRILDSVRTGRLSVAKAMEQIRQVGMDELGFATLDLHRAVRRGFPEVVFGQGKTDEQVVAITRRLHEAGQTVLVTRVGPEVHEAVVRVLPKAEYHPLARAVVVRRGRPKKGRPGIVVLTAGTSDIGVAEEAAIVAELMGNKVERVYDVGVAGLHRLMEHRDKLLSARVLVVVAGMEGALPSVVAGLTDCPVIGVPTSTGYGAGAHGEAALLAMLNSCAGGLTVVNIDNGFGAGYAASQINSAGRKSRK
jgi:NCAIR mutase (PurE)-related protein